MIPSTRPEPLAPGCFGFAITFNPKTKECAECDYIDKCQPAAYESIQKVGESIDVKDLSKLHATYGKEVVIGGMDRIGSDMRNKFSITQEQQAIIDSLSPRASVIAKGIYKRLGDPCLAMRAGVNPFDNVKPLYLAALAQQLIEGGTNRSILTDEYIEKNSNWTAKTAATRASMAFTLFIKMGFAKETNGVLVLL